MPVDWGVPPLVHWQKVLQCPGSQVEARGFWQVPSRQTVKMGQAVSSQHSVGGGMASQLVLLALAT